jgi:hypothetical protein
VTWELVPAHEHHYVNVYVVSKKKYKVCLIVSTEKNRTVV